MSENSLVIVTLDDVDDSDKLQRVKGKGRDGEAYGGQKRKVIRLQVSGLSARPSKGAVALALNLGGNNDQTVIMGGEHPDKRPTDLQEGETKLYGEAGGQTLHFKEGGTAELRCKTLTIIVEEAVTIQSGEKIVVDAPKVYLGSDGATKKVALQGATVSGGVVSATGCADKVFAE